MRINQHHLHKIKQTRLFAEQLILSCEESFLLFEGGLEEVIHAKFNNLRRLRSIARKLKKAAGMRLWSAKT